MNMISLPILLQQVTQTSVPGANVKLSALTIQGHYAYVCGSASATVSIFDIYNPKAPVLKSQLIAGYAGAYDVAIQGKYLYVPSNGGSNLYIVDVSNPSAPNKVGTCAITGAAGALYSCVVQGNYCYISTQNKGLTVVDVTNPALPVQVYQEGGTLNKSFGIAINGTTLYTTNFQTATPWTVRYLKTWNISTPTAPVLQNTYTLPANTKPLGITLSLDTATAFVTDGNVSRIIVVDITNPLAPNSLSIITPAAAFNSGNLAIVTQNQSSYLYVPSGADATHGGILECFDITNRSSPIKVTTAYTGVANAVFGSIAMYGDNSGNYVFAADYGVAPGSTCTLDTFVNNFPGGQGF